MINKADVIEAIKEPMARYYSEMIAALSNWQPLETAAAKLLDGKEVEDDEVPPAFLPLVQMMRLIASVTRESEWDWSMPEVQKFFENKAESPLYQIFTNAIVGTVISIIKKVSIGTLVEIGTGPGQVTKNLCGEMAKSKISIPVIISDRAPAIKQTREKLLKSFPAFAISDFVWDIRKPPPKDMVTSLIKPVLVFERFSLPYAGHDALDMISPIADILILQDDLSLTGKKMAFDVLYGRIGTRFLTFRQTRKHLKKHFSFIHTCDPEITEAINSSVTTFTLAIK